MSRLPSSSGTQLVAVNILLQGVMHMVEALFFWALAMYGALMIVWQSTKLLQKRRTKHDEHPVKVILVVQNAAQNIEGLLRAWLAGTADSNRDHTFFVMDVRSTDETSDIVKRLALEQPAIRYIQVNDEDDLLGQLREACVHSNGVACVYDLRDYGMLREAARDINSLFTS